MTTTEDIALAVRSSSRRYNEKAVWIEGATDGEKQIVDKIDARIAAIEAERASLTQSRMLLTNRCAQRALARRRTAFSKAKSEGQRP